MQSKILRLRNVSQDIFHKIEYKCPIMHSFLHIFGHILRTDEPGQISSSPDAHDICFTDLLLSDQVSLLSSFLLVTET